MGNTSHVGTKVHSVQSKWCTAVRKASSYFNSESRWISVLAVEDYYLTKWFLHFSGWKCGLMMIIMDVATHAETVCETFCAPRLIYMIAVCCLQTSERKRHIWAALTHYLNIRLLTACKWSPLASDWTGADWHPELELRSSGFNYEVWMWSEGKSWRNGCVITMYYNLFSNRIIILLWGQFCICICEIWAVLWITFTFSLLQVTVDGVDWLIKSLMN